MEEDSIVRVKLNGLSLVLIFGSKLILILSFRKHSSGRKQFS